MRHRRQQLLARIQRCVINYNSNGLSIVRVLMHVMGVFQFSYAVKYQIHLGNNNPDNEKLIKLSNMDWVGQFKYLTFINTCIQILYYLLAFLCDAMGCNGLYSKGDPKIPKIRLIKDYIFATLALPITMMVFLTFWFVSAMDREAADYVFPKWLNHIIHSNVLVFMIWETLICFRHYPKRSTGVKGLLYFLGAYIIWIHFIRFHTGIWVYPILEILTWPARYFILMAMVGFTIAGYIIGEAFNRYIWLDELRLLKRNI